uniref:Uncharacterized protein n=1 Tax=Ditylenchus dipsaci TaxID=166011 RepID=A0A915D2R7_9BILA
MLRNQLMNESLLRNNISSPAKSSPTDKVFYDSPMVGKSRKEVADHQNYFQTSPLAQTNGVVGTEVPTSGRTKGHLRGTRSNGFCSGPPFAKRPKHRNSSRQWGSTVDERQKQQQIELIEKEINVMAKESQCGVGKWRWAEFRHQKLDAVPVVLVLCHPRHAGQWLIPSSISTIERRFHLSTSTIGRIMQFYDFGYVLFCIPVSYLVAGTPSPQYSVRALL